MKQSIKSVIGRQGRKKQSDKAARRKMEKKKKKRKEKWLKKMRRASETFCTTRSVTTSASWEYQKKKSVCKGLRTYLKK